MLLCVLAPSRLVGRCWRVGWRCCPHLRFHALAKQLVLLQCDVPCHYPGTERTETWMWSGVVELYRHSIYFPGSSFLIPGLYISAVISLAVRYLCALFLHFIHFTNTSSEQVAESVQCLTTDRTAGVRSPTEEEHFSSSPFVQTGSGAHPASCTVGTGGKARPESDADHSPPSSAEVKKE
jgi:hypothetical protein